MKLVITIILLAITLFAAGTFFNAGKEVATKITDIEESFDQLFSASQENDSVKLKGEERDQVNFLFLGIGGEEHISGNYLTDTIILVALIPSSGDVAAISVPRDLMVRSPDGSYFTRINALYSIPPGSNLADPHGKEYKKFPGPMGVDHIKKAIKDITGVEADYYAVMDLAGVEKVVDILGGINVRRFEDIVDRAFPDDSYGYETYEINEGWRFLNGEEATKYIRTRHTAGGDFDRMLRQQEVALSIKKKLEGLSSLSSLPKLLSLYKELQSHFTTDLSFDELMRLMDIGKNVKSGEILFERIAADLPAGTVPDALLITDRVLWGGQEASILKPIAGTENYEEIRAKVAEIINTLKN